MADEKKKSFPKIPRANWFALRDRFKQKPPTEITISYLSSALNITEPSAANLIPPMKSLGLISDSNRLTDLAFEWRDDETYAQACKKMLEAVYPQEVRDLYHETTTPLRDVANWFAKYMRTGDSVAGAVASLYLLLLEADPTKKDAAAKAKTNRPAVAKASKAVRPAAKVAKTPKAPNGTTGAVNPPDGRDRRDSEEGGDQAGNRGFTPKLHVDIQIHISPESTADQIDKIFESMAKHLPLKG